MGLLLPACVLMTDHVLRAAEPDATVRVAAIQCHSRMADTSNNVRMLTGLIGKAARNGARIVVLPECAVTGYMNPARDAVWSTNPAAPWAVATWAETVPGRATTIFSGVASNLSLYLCIALVERQGGRFFNTQVLLNPRGAIIAHHRKKCLWPPGDASWASEGDLPVQVVDTEFGRIGLMICYDLHALPRSLSDKRADIVLHSMGWYGPNAEEWFRNTFPARHIRPNRFAVVGANWTSVSRDESWPGQGFSFIADKDGNILAMADDHAGSQVVYANLPVQLKQNSNHGKAAHPAVPMIGPAVCGSAP